MKKSLNVTFLSLVVLILVGFSGSVYAAEAVINSPAPDFTLTDTAGAKRSLSDYRGKFVVLEWNNPDCPFVKKHYESGNMQNLQAEYTSKGVIWLTINSSAAGKQGNYSPGELREITEKNNAKPTSVFQDPDGNVGKNMVLSRPLTCL